MEPVGPEASCQTDLVVVLYSVSITVLDAVAMTDRVVSIAQHSTPSNPNFECPLINQCDAPAFTALCVLGDTACINDYSGYCVLSVEADTWSAMKSLFR